MNQQLLQFDADSNDQPHLNTLQHRVWLYMKGGEWKTLWQIAQATRASEGGVGARLRDFRKARFQAIYHVKEVQMKRVKRGYQLRMYRLVVKNGKPENYS